MIVCVKCRKEMKCSESAIGVRFGESHAYSGDKFKCKECGTEIIISTSAPVHDPHKKINTIQMEE